MSERWSAGQGLQACAKCGEQKLIHGLSFRQAIFQLNKSSGFYGATSFNKTLG
jgi:ribosomal protein L32